jgi:hypothetical protein
MSTHDTGPPAEGPATTPALRISADAPERQAPMDKLTVIPAIFKDSERALAAMVDAKRALDAAMANLRGRERANAQRRAQRGHVVCTQAGVDEDYQRDQLSLDPLVVAVERARAEYDVAFAIYQETARARDAAAANRLAKSNNVVAAFIAVVTLVMAAATVFQTCHTWSK